MVGTAWCSCFRGAADRGCPPSFFPEKLSLHEIFDIISVATMSITKAQIEHLAQLARLEITEAEKKKYGEQIASILDYFNKLKELDTEGVDPLAQVFDLKDVTREDVATQPFSGDEVLAEAPELERRHIKVKKIFN